MVKAIVSFFLFILEILKIVVLALAIVIPIRYFLFQPFFVKGQSMEPNFENGDYLIIDELSYRFSDPKRGDVVVFKYPYAPSQRYIKRIIGLPGEKIEVKNGSVIISSEDGSQVLDEKTYLSQGISTPGVANILLNQNEYFVLGDNRSVSSDSRTWGTLPEENIIGKVFFRAWPINALAKIEAPAY
ncbi:signal peptidase I [Patescibacteria group bacterium]|nr:signal peptidase I [Patescibacteria group bacterium]MBU1877101.1 signal peptidase I [Patescibacteria group bacterium]